MKVLVILMVLALVLAMTFADDATQAPAEAGGTDEKYDSNKPLTPDNVPTNQQEAAAAHDSALQNLQAAGFRCTASGGVPAFIVTSLVAMFLN